MNRFLSFICAICIAVSIAAQESEQRHLFEEQFDAALAEGAFKTGAGWMPYPDYSDRTAWEKLSQGYKEIIIQLGEKSLKYEWTPIMASTYLEYEKTGNRALMKTSYDHRNNLIILVAAELVEGKGRFLPHLVDGLWLLSREYSWSLGQHTRYQASGRTLPDGTDRPITLHSANIGASIAYALYFFKDEFDKMDPSIAINVKAALKRNILDPFLDESVNNWWMHKKTNDRKFNNWTPYCVSHSVAAFLLCEEDQDRMIQALKLSAITMDAYMNDIGTDGACDEGPSYWDMAVGKVYDYARLMCDASCGKMDVFGDEMIRRMGEFKSKTYFGDGYVMNFADGECRAVGDLEMMFRYGYDTSSTELVDFVLYKLADPSTKMFRVKSIKCSYMSRVLETLRYGEKLREIQEQTISQYGGDWGKMRTALRKGIGSVWYDQTQVAILRKGNWTLAAKGGHNDESHNHNDVGSGILHVATRPVIIDPGVATYVKETFSPARYTLWNVQSDWHSVPKINGCSQVNGREFAASDVVCDIEGNSLVQDISGAYPQDAACNSWKRSWVLNEEEVVLVDKFSLQSRKDSDVENFIIRGDVYLPGDSTPDGYKVPKGEVVITAYSYTKKSQLNLVMTYPKKMTPAVTVLDLSIDNRVRKCWGDEIVKLSFSSTAKAPVKGQYEFRIKPFKN